MIVLTRESVNYSSAPIRQSSMKGYVKAILKSPGLSADSRTTAAATNKKG